MRRSFECQVCIKSTHAQFSQGLFLSDMLQLVGVRLVKVRQAEQGSLRRKLSFARVKRQAEAYRTSYVSFWNWFRRIDV